MSLELVRKDLDFLTADIHSPPDQLMLLRSSLELALIKLGHDQEEVSIVLDGFYIRTLH